MKTSEEFVINYNGRRTIQEVIKATKYAEINQLVKDGVKRRRISLLNQPIGDRAIVLLHADSNITTQQALDFARKHKLQRPTYGDAFLLGEKFPEESSRGGIVFLHDPEYLWSGFSFNLVLESYQKGPGISLVSCGGVWGPKYRLAFVRPRRIL